MNIPIEIWPWSTDEFCVLLSKFLLQLPIGSTQKRWIGVDFTCNQKIQIVKQRLALVQAESDIGKLEEKIGMGQIEEVIQQVGICSLNI